MLKNLASERTALVGQAGSRVQITDVSKTFGTTRALSETTLAVEPGEFLTLLGPSGCGKTTILNLVAGFLAPDTGDIFLGGERVTDIPPHRRGIGLTFQNYALFPHMNVADNIGYGLKGRGLSRAVREARVREALSLVKLDGLAARRPSELSGGQQQRVALARAVVIEPRVLLLDEPFSALDKNLRGAMQVELKELQRRLGITTIFVTHDQGEALSLSDRIAVMSEGRIRQVGVPQEIYACPADRFVARFIGEVTAFRAETVAPGAVRVGRGELSVAAPRPLDAGAAEVFVRPEAMSLVAPGAGLLDGTVEARVYGGGHVDVLVGTSLAEDGRALIRTGAAAGLALRDGETVGIAIAPGTAVAFAAEEQP